MSGWVLRVLKCITTIVGTFLVLWLGWILALYWLLVQVWSILVQSHEYQLYSVLGPAWTSSNYWASGLPWSLTVFPFYGSLVHYLYPLDGQSWVPTVSEYLTSLCALTVFQYMASPVHLLCLVLMCSCPLTVFSTWLFMSSDYLWMLHQSWGLTVFKYSIRCELWLYSLLDQSWALTVFHYLVRHEYWLYWILHQSWALTFFHYLASYKHSLSFTTWPVMSTDCIQDLINLELHLCPWMCPALSNCYVHSSISLKHWLYLIL